MPMNNRMWSQESLESGNEKPQTPRLLLTHCLLLAGVLQIQTALLQFSPHTVSMQLLRICHWFHIYATNHLKREANCPAWIRNSLLTHSTKPLALETWDPLLWVE